MHCPAYCAVFVCHSQRRIDVVLAEKGGPTPQPLSRAALFMAWEVCRLMFQKYDANQNVTL